MINAWNEWGERMNIEPSNEKGFYYLDKLNRYITFHNSFNNYHIHFTYVYSYNSFIYYHNHHCQPLKYIYNHNN